MFRPVKLENPKYKNVTEHMIDDEGLLITFLRLGEDGQWIMEYRDERDDLKFEFWARRNKDFSKALIELPKDYWVASFTLWSLVPAVLRNPRLDPDRLIEKIRSKITDALLTWPLDKYIHTTPARNVIFEDVEKGQTLRGCLEVAARKGGNNG